MCGRFASISITPEDLRSFGLTSAGDVSLSPRYNIAPSQIVPVMPNLNPRSLALFKWGLVPSWAKDPKMGVRLINARAETLAQKPSFKNAFQHQRCLVPASGFFEWEGEKPKKQPYYIRLKSNKTFVFAGLWESWQDPDKPPMHTFTIITTQANQLVGTIHDRMPVILKPENYHSWLDDSERNTNKLQKLLLPYPASEMEAYPVSSLVNRPSNDTAEIILPV